MQLAARNYLYEWEISLLNPTVPESDVEELLNKSHTFFEVWDDSGPLAYGGLLATRLISEEVYVWLIIRPDKFSVGQVRRGVRLARRFLASLPWKIFAETGNPVSEKFAQAVGFRFQEPVDERNLYLWGK